MEGKAGSSLLCYLNAVLPLYKTTKKSVPLKNLAALRDGEVLLVFLSLLIPEFFSCESESKGSACKSSDYKKLIIAGLNSFFEENFGVKSIFKKPKKKKGGKENEKEKEKNYLFLLSLVFTATIYCNSRNGVIKKILKLPSKVKSVLMVIAKGVVKDAPVVKPLDFTITQGEVSDDSDVDNSVTSDDEDEDDESDNENDSSDSDESESSESKESSEDSKSDTKKSKSSKEKAKTKKEKEDLEDSIKKKDKEIKALKKKISELEASRDYYKKNYIKAKTISERIFQRYKDIGESVIKYEKFQQEKQDKKDKKPKKKTHKVLINEGSENGGDPENEGGKSEDGDDDDGEGKSGDDSNGSGSDENENSSDSSSDGDSKKAPVLKYTTITDLDSLLS